MHQTVTIYTLTITVISSCSSCERVQSMVPERSITVSTEVASLFTQLLSVWSRACTADTTSPCRRCFPFIRWYEARELPASETQWVCRLLGWTTWTCHKCWVMVLFHQSFKQLDPEVNVRHLAARIQLFVQHIAVQTTVRACWCLRSQLSSSAICLSHDNL